MYELLITNITKSEIIINSMYFFNFIIINAPVLISPSELAYKWKLTCVKSKSKLNKWWRHVFIKNRSYLYCSRKFDHHLTSSPDWNQTWNAIIKYSHQTEETVNGAHFQIDLYIFHFNRFECVADAFDAIIMVKVFSLNLLSCKTLLTIGQPMCWLKFSLITRRKYRWKS